MATETATGGYHLKECTRGLGIETYNMKQGTSYTAAVNGSYNYGETEDYSLTTNQLQLAFSSPWAAWPRASTCCAPAMASRHSGSGS